MNAQTFLINGINLHCHTEGEGEPLLLLHGGTGCSEDWKYFGEDQFIKEYKLIMPDARGHGRSSNPRKEITHRQCALDMLALLDRFGIKHCRAIGLSMGGNILLHMATLQPQRIEAMVIVSATMYFPSQAREIMRQIPPAAAQPMQEWESMRKRHKLGDEQISSLWDWARGLEHSYDDMNFTPPLLSNVSARTLIVCGDRDPLYPVEMSVGMYRAIPGAELWVWPNSGHLPFHSDPSRFAQAALAFLKR